jgi:pimeloyl-ACP methyl ester carboxylesterase
VTELSPARCGSRGRGRRAAVGALGTFVLFTALTSCSATDDAGGNGDPSASSALASTSPSPPSSSADATSDVPVLVDIGGGRHLFTHCTGSGSPTVVLESGDESDQFQWSGVIPQVAAQTRVCAYDRLGNGSSDAATGCRRTPQILADLTGLLAAVDAQPPYVLVGTSGGGFLMASFAYAHTQQVAGIVLAETPHAIIPSQAPKELLAELDCHAAANQEHRDYVAVERQAWTHRHSLGRIPMTVITNDYRGNGTNNEEQTNVKGQQGWLALSPLARQVIVTTGHDVPENEPDLTVKEILRVLQAART